MFKSLLYKEWIKTRWFILGYLALAIIAIILLFLTVKHELTFVQAKNYWNSILFKDNEYFGAFKFIPIIGGISLGATQYVHEMIDKRIKLLFHLPLNENKMLVQLLLFGCIALTACYTILTSIFLVFSHFLFAREIIMDALCTIFPWLIAGYAAYFLVSLIVLEPTWKYRLSYFTISCLFLNLYFLDSIIAGYSTINLPLSIITLMLSITLILSGSRLKKGEQ